jgi:hypothetical protein
MLRIALAVGLLASTEASAHCYSRWYYPWPQHCFVSVRNVTGMPNQEHLKNKADAHATRATRAIALPSLAQADLDGGGADEPTRARLLLRAALEAANAH